MVLVGVLSVGYTVLSGVVVLLVGMVVLVFTGGLISVVLVLEAGGCDGGGVVLPVVLVDG